MRRMAHINQPGTHANTRVGPVSADHYLTAALPVQAEPTMARTCMRKSRIEKQKLASTAAVTKMSRGDASNGVSGGVHGVVKAAGNSHDDLGRHAYAGDMNAIGNPCDCIGWHTDTRVRSEMQLGVLQDGPPLLT